MILLKLKQLHLKELLLLLYITESFDGGVETLRHLKQGNQINGSMFEGLGLPLDETLIKQSRHPIPPILFLICMINCTLTVFGLKLY